MSDALHVARDLVERGYPITLCPVGTKKPLGKGWQSKRWTLRAIDRAFKLQGDLNVGLRFGSGSCIDIEADSADEERAFGELFAGCDVPITPTFASARGKHRLFAWHDCLATTKAGIIHFRGANGAKLGIRIGTSGKGAHSLVPRSTTDGFTRNWLVSLDVCNPATLPNLVLDRLLARKPLTPSTGVLTHDICVNPCVSPAGCNPAIMDAIGATIPTAQGHRYRRLFHLARRLKAIPEAASQDAGALESIVREWHRLSLPVIATKEWGETWRDFLNAWCAVKFAAGVGPIRAIFAAALAAELPAAALRYETESLRQLVALCRALQREAGDKPFFLACRIAGELLGVSHVLAHKWLRVLLRDGVLTMATPGTRHRAAEYHYGLD